MTAADRHPDELLDGWIDGRLDGDERREVEAHLAGCERCRRQAEALRAAVAAVRAGLPDSPPPADLAARVTAALDAEDARGEGPAPVVHPRARERTGGRRWRWSVAAAIAAAAALVVVALWLGSRSGGDLAGDLEAAYAELERGGVPAALETHDAGEVERRWQRAGLGFPARVFDLEAMGIHLAGGGATTLAGRPAALAAYRSDGGLLVCWMFEGAASELPAAVEIRHHGGFEFHVYRRGGRTLVLWQEGSVLCALVGRGDPENVIALAVAKAMAPPAAKAA
jgi:anti-sigma factor RsiW